MSAAESLYRRLVADGDDPDAPRRVTVEHHGDRAIVKGLNQDGVPCPSARRPDQNTHRLADGWQGSTVRSILENLMLDIMFELPEREPGKTYTITEKVVRGDEPLFKPSAA